MNTIDILIILLSAILATGTIVIGIITFLIRNKAAKDFKSRCKAITHEANIVHAGSDKGCIQINHTVALKSLGLIEFKDNDGNVLVPDDYDLYLVSGGSMQYVDIHPDDLVFATKGFDIEKYDGQLPIILILKKGASTPACYKLRRVWKTCNYNNDMKQILTSILHSSEFQEVRRRPIYDGDEELIKDFFDTRLPRYQRDYIHCANPNGNDEKIIISTTYHTDIEKVRFSIHPTSNIIGKAVAAFPLDPKYIQDK